MKYLSSLIIILLCLYLSGCKDSGTLVQGPVQTNFKYPDKLNYEWEYETITKFSYYNHSGGIDSTAYLSSDTSIIKIIKTNDSLKNYKGLIEFAIYNKYDPGNISFDWYLNSDTSFIAIAYYAPAATPVIEPKRNITRNYMTQEEYKKMIYLFSPDINSLRKTSYSDSVQYYDIPRKVLIYPLQIGNSWIELYTPFYRERYINGKQNIIAGNNLFECYEVKVRWHEFKMDINDYINLDAGLVKREIIADSIMVMNENGDPIGFERAYTTSTLVRRNF
jgi:hypothetical protein